MDFLGVWTSGATRTPALKMPVTVIVGEEDYATPLPMAQAMHQLIPGSKLAVIPGGRYLTRSSARRKLPTCWKTLSEEPRHRRVRRADVDCLWFAHWASSTKLRRLI